MILEVLFWVVLTVFVLAILMKIPGVELVVTPILQAAAKAAEFVVSSLSTWTLWFFIGIIRAHTGLISHLMHNEEYYDIHLRVERENRDA